MFQQDDFEYVMQLALLVQLKYIYFHRRLIEDH